MIRRAGSRGPRQALSPLRGRPLSAGGTVITGGALISLLSLCIGLGVTAAPMWLPVGLTVAVAAMALLELGLARDHVRTLETVAWLGLLCPLLYQPRHTAADIHSGTAVSGVLVAEAAVSVMLLLVLVARGSLSLVLPRPNGELLLLAYLAVTVTSATWSLDPRATLLKAMQLSVGYALLLAAVRLAAGALMTRLAWLVHLLSLAALVNAVVVPAHAFSSSGGGPPRLNSIVPTISGDLLALGAAVGILCVAANVGPGSHRIQWRLYMCAQYLTVIYLTRTRSALVILIVGLILLNVLRPTTRARSALVLPGAALGALVAWNTTSSQLTAFVSRGQSQAQLLNLTGRITEWRVAITTWMYHPLTGYGYFAGHRLTNAFAAVNATVSNLDNAWIESLFDVGLVGTLPLAMFVVAGIAQLVRARRHVHQAPLAISVAAVCLVSSFVNPSLEMLSYPMIIFGALLLWAPHESPARRVSQGAPGRASVEAKAA